MAARPPPVNWRTKPNANEQHSQDGSQSSSLSTSQESGAATDSPVLVYIHPAHLRDIEAALRHLGLPSLFSEGQAENYQVTNPTGRHFPQESDCTSSFSWRSMPTSQVQALASFPVRRSPAVQPTPLEYSDLTASFSRLSMPTSPVQAPVLLPVRSSPPIQLNSSPRKSLKKYYVITVGKCTGIFWDEW